MKWSIFKLYICEMSNDPHGSLLQFKAPKHQISLTSSRAILSTFSPPFFINISLEPVLRLLRWQCRISFYKIFFFFRACWIYFTFCPNKVDFFLAGVGSTPHPHDRGHVLWKVNFFTPFLNVSVWSMVNLFVPNVTLITQL